MEQAHSLLLHSPHVTPAAVQLQAGIGDSKFKLRALELGHASHFLVEPALCVQLNARVNKSARHTDFSLQVGQLVADGLEGGQRAYVGSGEVGLAEIVFASVTRV